jgi:uncharacterized protein (TIGR02266 family)
MERRRFARIPVNLMLKFKKLEAFEHALDGSANDLSQGGICITTPNVKPVGTRVQIELPIPGSEPIEIKGTVRSIRYNGGKPAAMGIEFDELEDPAQGVIRRLIEKHQSK